MTVSLYDKNVTAFEIVTLEPCNIITLLHPNIMFIELNKIVWSMRCIWVNRFHSCDVLVGLIYVGVWYFTILEGIADYKRTPLQVYIPYTDKTPVCSSPFHFRPYYYSISHFQFLFILKWQWICVLDSFFVIFNLPTIGITVSSIQCSVLNQVLGAN